MVARRQHLVQAVGKFKALNWPNWNLIKPWVAQTLDENDEVGEKYRFRIIEVWHQTAGAQALGRGAPPGLPAPRPLRARRTDLAGAVSGSPRGIQTVGPRGHTRGGHMDAFGGTTWSPRSRPLGHLCGHLSFANLLCF